MRRTIIIASFILTSAWASHAQESIASLDSIVRTDSTIISAVDTTEEKLVIDTTDALLKNEAPIIIMLPHHLGMNIGGGLHTMITDPQNGIAGMGFGGLFEMKYQFIPKHVGLSIGAKITLRNGFTTADYEYQTDRIHVDNGQTCTFTTKMQNWKEKENMWAVELPLQLLIASSTDKPWNFMAALGVSASLPFAGKYKTVEGNLQTTGYFDQTQVEYSNLNGHGFGETSYKEIERGDIEYARFGLNAIVDLGLLHNITHETGIYFGIYGSYGILNAMQTTDNYPYEYNESYNSNNTNSQNFIYNGLYNSQYISHIIPLEAGVKLGLYFNYHNIDKEISEKNKILAERVTVERQAAEEAAAERVAKAEEKNRKQELEKQKLERIQNELKGIREASRWEATQALKSIKESAKYANVNATPIFPSSVDEDFMTIRKYLDSHSDAKIVITGHTDNSGTPAKNIVNGQHRAEAFKTALVKKNIPSDRIGCVSKGETEPIADNETPEGRLKNCRVDLDIVEQNEEIIPSE